MALQRAVLQPGGRELIVYATINGAIGEPSGMVAVAAPAPGGPPTSWPACPPPYLHLRPLTCHHLFPSHSFAPF